MTDQTLSAPASVAPQRGSTSLDLEMVRRSKLASVFVDSYVLAERHLRRIPRQLDWLVGVTIMPIMFLLLFRYVFGGTVQATMPPGVNAVNYLVLGILVQGVVFGGINTALGLAMDAKEGLMDRFRVLPMTRVSVILGRIMADMAITVFTTTITILAGLAVGFRTNASIGEWLLAIVFLLYTAFVLAWLGAVIGFWLKSVEAVNSIGFSVIFPLTFLSSAFTNPDFLPGWLQGFAKNQPFTLVVDTIRGLLTGYPEIGNKGWIAMAWLTAILVVMVPLALWMHERRAESA